MDKLVIVDEHNSTGQHRKICINKEKVVSLIPSSNYATQVHMDSGVKYLVSGDLPDVYALLRHSKLSAVERKVRQGLQGELPPIECLVMIKDIVDES